MRIAVAGGTGLIGRMVVAHAERRGHEAIPLSRSCGVDVETGEGLGAALDGADSVVDVLNVDTLSARRSTAYFTATARNLLTAAERSGIRHAVLLSIVGVDRNPHGYYAGKLAQEEAYHRGSVPVTIQRATQFHEFAGQLAARTRLGPLQLAPRGRAQPIAADEVAERLVTLALHGPQGRATDVAGPREEDLADMVTAWAGREGRRAVRVALPGAQMRGMRAGENLPAPDALLLGPTFADWLAAHRR